MKTLNEALKQVGYEKTDQVLQLAVLSGVATTVALILENEKPMTKEELINFVLKAGHDARTMGGEIMLERLQKILLQRS
jgi:hypothetical protein